MIISLRDYFAAQAMKGMLSNPDVSLKEDDLVKLSYSIADKMIDKSNENNQNTNDKE